MDDAHATFSSRSTPVRPHRPNWNAPSGKLCHAARSHDGSRRPDRKTQKQQRPRTVQTRLARASLRWGGRVPLPLMWAILCGLLLSCVEAEYIVQVAKPLDHLGVGQRSALLFDRSEAPIPAPRVRLGGVEKRQEQESISATPSFIPAPTGVGGGEDSSSFGIPTATGSPKEDLPSPFDTSLGNNFTAPSCPAFFQSFLSNATFQDCLPFSLLLQTSNAFFTTTRSLVDLTRTLDATCNIPNLQACVATMSSLAIDLQSPSHCGADFELENPMVRQAYAGFVAYQPLYHAGCLTNSAGDYCYAAAVNNASATTAAYVYYLPLGVSLPVSSTTRKPGCSQCLRDTMSVFALYAGDKAQPLSETYASAAEQLDGSCGAKFVEAAKVSTNGAASTTMSVGLTSLVATLLIVFFLV